jgi:hypothetical protein
MFSMLKDYLGAAWQFIDTVKCLLGENYRSYAMVEGLPLFQVRNSTYLNKQPPQFYQYWYQLTTSMPYMLSYHYQRIPLAIGNETAG